MFGIRCCSSRLSGNSGYRAIITRLFSGSSVLETQAITGAPATKSAILSSQHPLIFPSYFPPQSHPNFRGFASEAAENGAGEAENQETSGDSTSSAVTEKNPKDRRTPIPWQVSVAYMKSDAYRETYGNEPVWKPYRRQHKGAIAPKLTRKSCVRRGLITTGSPCPLCRDEYLTLDYRHTELLKQFISPHTGEILNWSITNICQRKYQRLVVELMKARYFGTMEFKTPFRHYNYSDYYSEKPTHHFLHATPENSSDSRSLQH